MKILKIELQNINSLKAENPIVVDFQDKHFSDVGLYAITGSTGAGKTTLLDAITIALYHTAPRFNGQTKAGLEDAVSYGAAHAFSRITFENNGIKYEAQWNIRLYAKNGNKLDKPKEEVRLKNLSDERIIAEKKTEVKTCIEDICQLNYNQFLRSVMLAQGEFASFLSASAQDKGKLLEQITGEDIYRKIGESINSKIYTENKALESIRAKINNEDLLSEEKRNLLKFELKELSETQQKLESKLLELQKTLEWSKKWQEAIQTEEKLKQDKALLEQVKKEKESVLQTLRLHEKAKPFQKEVESLKRNTLEFEQKQNKAIDFENNLVQLNNQLKQADTNNKHTKELFETNAQLFHDWQPKLDQVSKLDANILNIKNNLITQQQNYEQQTSKLASLETRGQRIPEQLSLLEGKLRKTEIYLKNNQSTLKLEPQINKVNSLLQQRIANNNNLAENISRKKNEDRNLIELGRQSKEFKVKQIELRSKEKETTHTINRINTQINSTPLTQLLDDKEKLNQKALSLSQALVLSKSFIATKKQYGETKNELDIIFANIKQASQKLENLEEQKRLAEQLVIDGEKILQQEQQLIKYETDRNKLSKGETCPLCGSLEHPLIDNYQKPDSNNTEKDLVSRKDDLKKLANQYQEASIHIEKLRNKNESGESKLEELTTLNNNNSENYQKLNLEFDLVKTELFLVYDKQLKQDSENLANNIQEVQKQTNEQTTWTNKLNETKQTLAVSENQLSNVSEKEKESKKNISELNLQIYKDQELINNIELKLNQILNPLEFSLPTKESSLLFIDELSQQIKNYQDQSKISIEIKTEREKLLIENENLTNLIRDELKVREKSEKEIKEQKEQFITIQKQRSLILPLDESTHSKRKTLLDLQGNSKTNWDKALENFNTLSQNEAVSKNTIKDLAQELEQLSKSNEDIRSSLNGAIKSTEFSNTQELSLALLDEEQALKAIDIKSRIEAQQIKLDTLQEQLAANQSTLNKSKPETELLEFAENQFSLLEEEKSNLLKRQGEIKQQFELDNQIIERNKGVLEQIKQQEKNLGKWTGLMNIIGGSKHAFNTYVQRLTLQQLIHLANIHLYSLNQRYSLKLDEKYKKGEELSFKLVDHYQSDQIRYIDTSSGGEKFLISLALALGLSDLASNHVNIDSLFIDEGFGTLDSKTLDIVISSLETLQAQGKTIGIISHVENLKERIPTQIQVFKKSNGVSVVEIK